MFEALYLEYWNLWISKVWKYWISNVWRIVSGMFEALDLDCLNYWISNVWSIVSRMFESLNLESLKHWISNVWIIESRKFEALYLECLKHWTSNVWSIESRLFELLNLECLKHCISNVWAIVSRMLRTLDFEDLARDRDTNSLTTIYICTYLRSCVQKNLLQWWKCRYIVKYELSVAVTGINHMWILKNSKDLLDNLKSRSFSRVSSIKLLIFQLYIPLYRITN